MGRRCGYGLLILFLLAAGALTLVGQEVRYADARCMVLRCEGRLWNALAVYVDADEAQRESVWIDRNGNGLYEESVDIPPEDVQFGEWREYFFVGSTLRIYGGVRELQCDYSDPMRLDVSGNPALERLNCAGNRLLELNVSGNVRLTHLNCNNNLLSKLDVAGLPALKSLQCAGNQLRKIDVASNPQLADLDVSYNFFSRLDLQQNGQLKRLDCVDCGLRELRVDNLTQLEFLDCSINRIRDLDLSHCVELRFLNCRSNALKKLTLTALAQLRRLVCYKNEIEDLTVATPSQLVYVECQNNRLSYAESAYIVESLPTITPLRSSVYDALEARFPYGTFSVEAENDANRISSESVARAKEKRWKVITSRARGDEDSGRVVTPTDEGVMRLYLSGDTLHFKLWLEGEAKDKNRIWVDINANGIFDAGVDVDAAALKYGEWMSYEAVRTEVRVYGRVAALLVLAQGQLEGLDVSENPRLKKLGCSGNRLTMLDLRRNAALEVLICSDNMLSMLDLSMNGELRELHCNANRLTALSVQANRKLERLYCMGNLLKVLLLQKNKMLRHLDCSGNRIEYLDVSALRMLEQFGCSGNGLRHLKMKSSSGLYYVNVSRNELSYGEMSRIVDVLPKIEANRPAEIDETTYAELYGVFRGYAEGDGNDFSTDLAQYLKSKGWKVR